MVRIELDEALTLLERKGLHVRDAGLLDSALARPAATAFGEPAYGTVSLAAAAQTESLARNHPLFDGNKRTAVYLLFVFLRLNGYLLKVPDDALYTYILNVAQGSLTLEESAAFLQKHITPWSR
ncbi:type II toxin-antitoxin system death-on-curing family toxin [Nesterenkonia alba]|uniref:type II toxin-antitoxin system death-on-curing family toxin n=1 Tax=Nesterenkonia alba TaxID=515814 RepID=UPI0003B51637|nr:type II toxin-antitoxin system death-on-curing family toxin [Nesterenkonia alba]